MLNFKNEIIIKDPHVKDSVTISNILEGEYTYLSCHDNFDDLGDRITSIRIYNTNYTNLEYDLFGKVYIDTGHCVIGDRELLQQVSENSDFIQRCCELSLKRVEDPAYKEFNRKFERVNKDNVAEFSEYLKQHDYRMPYKYEYVQNCEEMNDKCLVSATGFGDGDYNIYVAKNSDGKIIGIEIIFIEDDIDN